MPTSSAENPAALATSRLVAGYGDVPVLRGVDVAVQAGQFAAVVGPNGAGKSTLLKAILGLAKIMDGTVRAQGRDITGARLERLVRLGIGYVPQVDDAFDPLTVRENLSMGGYLLAKQERTLRMEQVLEIFPPLRARLGRHVATLSGGERKMTAIARALMLTPKVLVLDEPTAGLSPALTEQVLTEQVRALADRGHAVLLVEQKAQAALRLADFAYVLVRGEVVMAAPAAEVLASPDMAEVFLGGRVPEAPEIPETRQVPEAAGLAHENADQGGRAAR
jgi:ABC-type branched-subunit amino acid transport system ATPase component